MACNEIATENFRRLGELERQEYIRQAFGVLVKITSKRQIKILLNDAFEKFELIEVQGADEEFWLAEISSRRMGIDNGKDTLVHVDQILERTLNYMRPEAPPEQL